MAFHGDLSSYPLPDLLQWLDGARKSGVLQIEGDGGVRRLEFQAGQVAATSSPGEFERIARVLEHGTDVTGAQVLAALRSSATLPLAIDVPVRQLAEELVVGAVMDFTSSGTGRFHWSDEIDRGDEEWLALDLPVRHLLYEALRRLDEVGDVERSLPGDALTVRAVGAAVPSNVLHRVIVQYASRAGGTSVGRLWIQFGLTRTLVLRALFDLLRAGRVEVDGAMTPESDPVADMLEKGALLLRERQFDAAQLIFSSLLQTDPTDRRVRDFVRTVDREHAASLYRELPPVTTFLVYRDPQAFSAARPEERQLVQWMDAGFDVSALVLASPWRELDTLKVLARLVRQGVIAPRER